MTLDSTIIPDPEIQGWARGPASPLRVYESRAYPGTVSFHLSGESPTGLRVSREQLELLVDELIDYLT